jgi:hypothetical protein
MGNRERDGTMTGTRMGYGQEDDEHKHRRDGTEKVAEMGRDETGRNGLLAEQATGEGTG